MLHCITFFKKININDHQVMAKIAILEEDFPEVTKNDDHTTRRLFKKKVVLSEEKYKKINQKAGERLLKYHYVG